MGLPRLRKLTGIFSNSAGILDKLKEITIGLDEADMNLPLVG
jgi:hypothetical protein